MWQAPGADEVFGIILRNWGHMLPSLHPTKNTIIVIDLVAAQEQGRKVKKEIPDIVKIEDDDEDGEEMTEFMALPQPPKTIEEVEARIAYLKSLARIAFKLRSLCIS